MAFVSTNQFGITTATLKAGWIAFLKTADDTALENAIDVVSGDVCRMLWAIGIDPASITVADFPDDYVNLGNVVAIGSLGQYGLATAANQAQARGWSEEYSRRLDRIRVNPSEYLRAYTQIDGVNSVRSHTEGLSPSQLQAARGIFWDPLNRINSWTR
jgi:hypothetical protein